MGKKKIKRIVITSAVIIALGATSVLAYFMSRDARTDRYRIKSSADKNGLKIYEKYDAESSEDTMPGNVVEKNLQIQNTASYEQFVRVKITPTFTDSPNFAKEVPDNNLIQLGFTNIESNIESATEGKWLKGNDGYYYYLGKVATSGFTSELLNNFSIHINTDNQYIGAGFDIQVEAEAIQTQNDIVLNHWSSAGSEVVNKVNSFKDSQAINNGELSK